MRGRSVFEKQQQKLQSYKGYGKLLSNFEKRRIPRRQVTTPLVRPKQEYTCDELQQFIRFFPSHFTLRLNATSLRYRHILDEVLLVIHSIPPKHRIPQYNLLGYLFALQGNYNYAFRSVTKESQYMSDAKTDLGYAYSVFGLTNAAKRMYESALTYSNEAVNANLGMAECLLTISYHENRSKRDFYLKSALSYLAIVQIHEPTAFLPACILGLRVRAENKAMSLNQIDHKVEQILKEYHHLLDAKVYRDLASVKLNRRDFDGELGAINLLEKSVEALPTSQAYHMLGKAQFLKWYKDRRKKRGRRRVVAKEVTLNDVKEGDEEEGEGEGDSSPTEKKLEDMDEGEMFQLILSYYESAAKKCYNSNLEILLDLGVVCGRLGQFNRATQLIKQAVLNSEDISIQERGYRYLAIFELKDAKQAEEYLRECLSRQHFVKLSEIEKHEFWERVYGHAEELLIEKGPAANTQYWIKLLVENLFPRADHIVELYNKESHTPLRGLNGEIPVSKKTASRKHSRSRMIKTISIIEMFRVGTQLLKDDRRMM
eukprot:sb/3463673/